jgi:3-deoxy-manno-octulosonate cytidylyltransferase (CMP-KDO synthetase)
MKVLICIPARWKSTRFPGKPLHLIGGVSMLARTADVARRAARLSGARIVCATDDKRIFEHAVSIGIEAVMTDPDLASGTDRARAAADLVAPEADFIVNLQGDAPFTPAGHVTALINAARSAGGSADVTTPVVALTWKALDELRERKRTTPFSGTTCIRATDGRALWFSKAILPAIRSEAALRASSDVSPVLQHIGLYGYTRAALETISRLPVSPYEELEGLEQLRFLENGLSVQAVLVPASELAISGIDTPSDAQLAEGLLMRHGDPYGR